MYETIKIIKKDGRKELFIPEKICAAIKKSAERVSFELEDNDCQIVVEHVIHEITRKYKLNLVQECAEVPISIIHNFVEQGLDILDHMYGHLEHECIAKSYRDYRNYKQDFVKTLDEVYKRSQAIMYIGDKENSNTDSALVSTKRSLIFNELNKSLYQKFSMTSEELQACKDGYIYIHDMSARRDTMNCCLFDVANVLKGGFEMGNVWYNEPKTVDTCCDVIGDIVLSAASQQYGGFTVPNVEKILAPYAEKSYERYKKINQERIQELIRDSIFSLSDQEKLDAHIERWAMEDLRAEIRQGIQGWEYKFNTVGSSRGDYPFITMTFGNGTERFEKLISLIFLQVHKDGQGKEGFKKPVLFPKLVFLYDEALHGKGMELEDVFEAALDCSAKTMYPDYLSLTGEGYVPSMYKKYKKAVSPMGCRAFLSPWYEKGGMYPADENDEPVFVGRFNIGVVSLNLPMIFAKTEQEGKDFYEILDHYLEMIRKIHLKTYEYLGNMKASCNPLAYCEGGFYKGHLNPNEKIAPVLESATASFGITALNELQRLYNKKSLAEDAVSEDGHFALEVMQYINQKIEMFKKEDGKLYAIYGTPAENLCGKQVEQFRMKYGIITNVSDRDYVSNSFHCHVTEDITPIQKQNYERRFWNLFNGGKIQYVRYRLGYNKEAMRTLIRRAMKFGFYEGVNLSLAYCNECGHEEIDMNTCPHCGSNNLTKIDRMNGYLSYSRVKGDTRLSDAKMSEIKERISM